MIVDVERAGFGLSPTVFSFLIVTASDDFRVVFVFCLIELISHWIMH